MTAKLSFLWQEVGATGLRGGFYTALAAGGLAFCYFAYVVISTLSQRPDLLSKFDNSFVSIVAFVVACLMLIGAIIGIFIFSSISFAFQIFSVKETSARYAFFGFLASAVITWSLFHGRAGPNFFLEVALPILTLLPPPIAGWALGEWRSRTARTYQPTA